MKIHYVVRYEGVVDINNKEWDQMKEDYIGSLDNFVLTTVSEAIHEFNEDSITITSVED